MGTKRSRENDAHGDISMGDPTTTKKDDDSSDDEVSGQRTNFPAIG